MQRWVGHYIYALALQKQIAIHLGIFACMENIYRILEMFGIVSVNVWCIAKSKAVGKSLTNKLIN